MRTVGKRAHQRAVDYELAAGSSSASDVRAVYASGWWIISGSAILGALAAFGMTPSRRPADTPAADGEPRGPSASDRSTASDQSAAR
ncbi:hypothetical protein ACFYSJ_22340 [Streptomyces sp. NPDC005248]|uniref:hypothetical protein n=1 Tax=unclassified Streptomyces TaxID=2593676 RepID=UPI00339EB23F